jgi:hypothetical protein
VTDIGTTGLGPGGGVEGAVWASRCWNTSKNCARVFDVCRTGRHHGR